jgi:hypothetical protein
MTYQQLLQMIQTLDKDQLDREVLVYDSFSDGWYDDGTELKVTSSAVPGLVDSNFPYLRV